MNLAIETGRASGERQLNFADPGPSANRPLAVRRVSVPRQAPYATSSSRY